MQTHQKIYIAGHRGMVGSALERKLRKEGFNNIITRSSHELDLRDQKAVQNFFYDTRPELVFIAAAKVGGIYANNTFRAEFIYNNLMIEANIIHASFITGAEKLMFLGSSCIYPKMAPQPLKEEYLLSDYLEETNKSYAVAKIAGIELCDAYRAQYNCNYISVMPTNLYGPNDNYHPQNAHVLPALLRKFIKAKMRNEPYVQIWGSGTPKREFLHADDLAGACYFLMQTYNEPGIINIGTGEDIPILDLAIMIKDITGFDGEIKTDTSKPDGTPRKLMDVSKLKALGWQPGIKLKAGIESVYKEILEKGIIQFDEVAV